MEKLQRGVSTLNDDGIASTTRRIPWFLFRSYVLKNDAVAPYFKSVFGKALHQKLLAYPVLNYWPRIRNPRTFNEKILHRQLYTDNDLFVTVEDKLAAREYVEDPVGEDILPGLYHVTDDPSTIPFGSLPDEYVVKPTHLSGDVLIVDDDETPDESEIRQQCRTWLQREHGTITEQYWYGEIEPAILIEERLKDDEHDVPPDFKFHVFHGRAEYVEVAYDRFGDRSVRYYDRGWEPQAFRDNGYPLAQAREKPDHFDEMLEIADVLGADFDYIRVDLYLVNDERIVFGEFTVGPSHGHDVFPQREHDLEFGQLW